MFLKNIKNIFIKDKNGYKYEVDAINNLLTYNDFKLFEDFQNDLINAKDKPNLINLILTEFEDSTKDF
jgi:hypothetical protein